MERRETRQLREWLKGEGVARRAYTIGTFDVAKCQSQWMREREAGVKTWYQDVMTFGCATMHMTTTRGVDVERAKALIAAAIEDGYSTSQTFINGELSCIQLLTVPPCTERRDEITNLEVTR